MNILFPQNDVYLRIDGKDYLLDDMRQIIADSQRFQFIIDRSNVEHRDGGIVTHWVLPNIDRSGPTRNPHRGVCFANIRQAIDAARGVK